MEMYLSWKILNLLRNLRNSRNQSKHRQTQTLCINLVLLAAQLCQIISWNSRGYSCDLFDIRQYFSSYFTNNIPQFILGRIVNRHNQSCILSSSLHCTLSYVTIMAGQIYQHFESSYGLTTARQHPIYLKWRHIAAQSATRIGITEPYPFMGMRSFTLLGDDSPSTQDL